MGEAETVRQRGREGIQARRVAIKGKQALRPRFGAKPYCGANRTSRDLGTTGNLVLE